MNANEQSLRWGLQEVIRRLTVARDTTAYQGRDLAQIIGNDVVSIIERAYMDEYARDFVAKLADEHSHLREFISPIQIQHAYWKDSDGRNVTEVPPWKTWIQLARPCPPTSVFPSIVSARFLVCETSQIESSDNDLFSCLELIQDDRARRALEFELHIASTVTFDRKLEDRSQQIDQILETMQVWLAWLELNELNAGQGKPEQPKVTEQENGPFGMDKFRWNGKTVRGIEPQPYRLIAYLWEHRGKEVAFSELGSDVFGDHAHVPNSLKNVALRARQALRRAGYGGELKCSDKHMIIRLEYDVDAD